MASLTARLSEKTTRIDLKHCSGFAHCFEFVQKGKTALFEQTLKHVFQMYIFLSIKSDVNTYRFLCHWYDEYNKKRLYRRHSNDKY